MSDTQQERTVALGFYASELMAERLKEAAREQERSMSAVIRGHLGRAAAGRVRPQ
jgi:hypothetical protein